ncbi:class II aldolase/adducin family protein [Ramlibacter sp. USB13]|uniref:Class II aldolase/adducin family protein n=1 Tax=Ramlibacter cellulosilyticus TaxID=2764187 RepID=A0A923MPJ2_9BURK|nr:class II aldolase/adducin family protein [Ramlibacter cellulosilyticus]MBC5782541.1 class II aldolase/adducin family protein [Ramlibacter cellulosilyticus]
MTALHDAFQQRRPAGMGPAEWQVRCELAAAYRLFAHLGWHELIYNHLTVRVPGTENFLINPFGLMYREITAAQLVKIDLEGRKVEPSPWDVNPAGFIVHAAVHAARPDAQCVVHTHTTAGQVVSCQRDGLLPLSFNSTFYTGRIAYHDFEGITLDREECARLAADLGDRNVMILRNHGLLVCGPGIGDAFAEHYMLQRACEVQVAAQASGAPLVQPRPEVAERAAAQYERTARQGNQNTLLWDAMLRWAWDLDSGFVR